jgi:8-oxo-dGTP diphosphatase
MAVTVVAGLIWQEGRVLICRRRLDGAFPGKWEFPGGKIEAGEEPQAALQRELEEELGIQATIGEEICRVKHEYPDQRPVRLHFFDVVRFEGHLQNRVFSTVSWVLPGDLAAYDFLEADERLIERLVSGEPLHRDS